MLADFSVGSLRDVNRKMKEKDFGQERDFNSTTEPQYKGPYIPKLYTVSFFLSVDKTQITKTKMWEVPSKGEFVLFEGKEYEIIKIVRDLEIHSQIYAVVARIL